MDELLAKLNAALDKVGELTLQHGPDAVDLALAAVRFDGIFNLICGFVLLAIAATGLGIAFYCIKRAKETYPNEEGYVFGAIFCIAVSLFVGVGALINLFTPYNWAAAIDPKMGLALKLLGNVL